MNDDGIARMKAYDHLKLYIISHRIRWRYPALSNDQVRWQQAAARLDPRRLPHQLAVEGFAAVVIDRYGYENNGTEITADIRAGLGRDDVIARTDRYIALDIRSLAGASEAAAPLLYFKRPEYRGSGFTAAIPAEKFGKGQHALALRVVSSDRRCYYQTPGRSIIVD